MLFRVFPASFENSQVSTSYLPFSSLTVTGTITSFLYTVFYNVKCDIPASIPCIDITLKKADSSYRKVGKQASGMGVENHLLMTVGIFLLWERRCYAAKPAFTVVC